MGDVPDICQFQQVHDDAQSEFGAPSSLQSHICLNAYFLTLSEARVQVTLLLLRIVQILADPHIKKSRQNLDKMWINHKEHHLQKTR